MAGRPVGPDCVRVPFHMSRHVNHAPTWRAPIFPCRPSFLARAPPGSDLKAGAIALMRDKKEGETPVTPRPTNCQPSHQVTVTVNDVCTLAPILSVAFTVMTALPVAPVA